MSATSTVSGQGPVHASEIETALRAALQPELLLVRDDTAAHIGHAGHNGQAFGTHFEVRVRAACFRGLPPVQRHRLVYDALRNLMPRGIHALAIQAEPA
ncbi:BolA/IbaG family iron-sulfur metabolism protein [Aquabacterium fontiphilum]|jgi:BolA protein|uniref:BolA family protein n=1 Tax=Aquabacterium fontiphilum TaxID=450365 RepID=UPI00137667B7|nr:BolA family protein [Aquabacterium fontiphilum]NBD22005.1 BolA/IbaG family iron-sulfur metabolism protein [Aquabacterium fontiphilum]